MRRGEEGYEDFQGSKMQKQKEVRSKDEKELKERTVAHHSNGTGTTVTSERRRSRCFVRTRQIDTFSSGDAESAFAFEKGRKLLKPCTVAHHLAPCCARFPCTFWWEILHTNIFSKRWTDTSTVGLDSTHFGTKFINRVGPPFALFSKRCGSTSASAGIVNGRTTSDLRHCR